MACRFAGRLRERLQRRVGVGVSALLACMVWLAGLGGSLPAFASDPSMMSCSSVQLELDQQPDLTYNATGSASCVDPQGAGAVTVGLAGGGISVSAAPAGHNFEADCPIRFDGPLTLTAPDGSPPATVPMDVALLESTSDTNALVGGDPNHAGGSGTLQWGQGAGASVAAENGYAAFSDVYDPAGFLLGFGACGGDTNGSVNFQTVSLQAYPVLSTPSAQSAQGLAATAQGRPSVATPAPVSGIVSVDRDTSTDQRVATALGAGGSVEACRVVISRTVTPQGAAFQVGFGGAVQCDGAPALAQQGQADLVDSTGYTVASTGEVSGPALGTYAEGSRGQWFVYYTVTAQLPAGSTWKTVPSGCVGAGNVEMSCALDSLVFS